MFAEFGGLFGWLLIVSFGCTLLNYCVKFVNKKWGKKISANDFGKKIMKLLMTVFVRHHKFFGLLTALLLIAHFAIQFSRFGISLTGLLAAALIILQASLGIYAALAHRPRKGMWFIAHRTIAILIVFGIAFHLLAPYALNSALLQGSTASAQSTVATSNQTSSQTSTQTSFTKDELAKYNGKNGNPAYVAYKNVVYDVSNNRQWVNGQHNGHSAGADLTQAISASPHGATVFKDLPVVGAYVN